MIRKIEPVTENGIVIGNTFNKYKATNPLHRKLMAGFLGAFDSLIAETDAREVHEIGCGEGNLSRRMASAGLNVRGSDFSTMVIAEAEELGRTQGIEVPFKSASIYDLDPNVDSAELIVCCEVLEHLPESKEALKMLARLTRSHLIASVPREPLWRILNFARGKYWSDLGNTPGHLQHWSKTSFVKFISTEFHVERVLSPLPWTMVLAKPRR